jgi:hypothetical protein
LPSECLLYDGLKGTVDVARSAASFVAEIADVVVLTAEAESPFTVAAWIDYDADAAVRTDLSSGFEELAFATLRRVVAAETSDPFRQTRRGTVIYHHLAFMGSLPPH